MFEGIEEFIPIIGTICEHPVHRVLFAAVLLDLIKERGEHPVVRHGFIGDLQAEELVGFDVDHGMNFDPTAPDPPLLSHPFAPIGDLDPGTVNSDDDILSEDLGRYVEREIQQVDPAKEGGIVGSPERGNECRKFPGKPLHLAIGHLQEDMDAGHPSNERFEILIRPTALASVHPGKEFILTVDEVKGEIEFSTPHQAFILYTPIASVRVRAFPAFFLWHRRPAGAPVIITFAV